MATDTKHSCHRDNLALMDTLPSELLLYLSLELPELCNLGCCGRRYHRLFLQRETVLLVETAGNATSHHLYVGVPFSLTPQFKIIKSGIWGAVLDRKSLEPLPYQCHKVILPFTQVAFYLRKKHCWLNVRDDALPGVVTLFENGNNLVVVVPARESAKESINSPTITYVRYLNQMKGESLALPIITSATIREKVKQRLCGTLSKGCTEVKAAAFNEHTELLYIVDPQRMMLKAPQRIAFSINKAIRETTVCNPSLYYLELHPPGRREFDNPFYYRLITVFGKEVIAASKQQ